MAQMVPVDYDPFSGASDTGQGGGGVSMVPVDHDPFAQSDTMTDVAKSGASGLAKGAISIPGIFGDISRFADYGPAYLAAHGAEKLGLLPQGKTADDLIKSITGNYTEAAKKDAQNPTVMGRVESAMGPTSDQLKTGAENVTGQKFYQPQTAAGKYADTIGQGIPGALIGGGMKAIVPAITAGAGSEAAGQATAGSKYEPIARIVGALAGNAVPTLASRVVTPNPMSDSRRTLVDTLDQEGVPLTAGQRTGSKPLQWAESTLGDMPGAGGKAAAIQEQQGQAFTNAAIKRMGVTDETAIATPDVLKAGKDKIGQSFNDLSARNTVSFDPKFGQDLGKVVNQYDKMLPAGQQSPAVQQYIGDIASLGGQMPGTMYQTMRSQIGKEAEAIKNSNPPLADALRGIGKALDEAMGRSISPADKSAWEQARKEWKNWKVIEKASTGAGAAAQEGYISPQALRTAVVGQNRGAYATGQGDLSALARAGAGVMAPLPNSGTAPRQNIQDLIKGMSAAAGAAVGSPAGPAGMAAGGGIGYAAGLLAPAVAGRALMSSPAQSWLGNQIMPKAGLLNDALSSQKKLGLLLSAHPSFSMR